MRNLVEYLYQKVKVVCTDGKSFVGEVTGYETSVDNLDYQGIDSESFTLSQVTLEGDKYGVDIYRNEIKSIEVIS